MNKGPKVTKRSCLDGVCLRHQLRHHFRACVGLLPGLELIAEVDVVLGVGMWSGQFIGARDLSRPDQRFAFAMVFIFLNMKRLGTI